jgi:D-alanine transaminase
LVEEAELMDWQQGTCYLNGEWLPLAEARIPVLDRGFIFGDGVYEVIPVDTVDGIRAPFQARPHFARLQRSLDAVRIVNPNTVEQWIDLMAELVDRHPWQRQLVYIQVTRGVAKRDHPFPAGVTPTVFMNSSPWPAIPAEQIENGIAAVTHADERWLHCDIKSISLLGNVLMKQYAMDKGASETVMLRDGFLTEGSSTNVMIVKNGVVVAPLKTVQILPWHHVRRRVRHREVARTRDRASPGAGGGTAGRRRSLAELFRPGSARHHRARWAPGRRWPSGTGVPASARLAAARQAHRGPCVAGRARRSQKAA